MSKHRIKLSFFLAALLLASLACEFSGSTANIKDAWLAHDPDGVEPTIIFMQDETLYCVVDLANAPDETNVKIIWTALEAEGIAPDTVLSENEYSGASSTITFRLNHSQLWAVGKYKADLYLDNQLDRTLEFTVYALETAEP